MNNFGIRLRAWGPWALFTRPEMKAERVSFDVITSSGARGILEAVYWKPQMRWVIDRIHVLRPIRFAGQRRNELGSVIPAGAAEAAMKAGSGALGIYIEEDRQQRAGLLLRDVKYIIEAHFEVLDPTDSDGRPLSDAQAAAKHLDQFNRRARAGQCFHRPYLGTRECDCSFELVEPDQPIAAITAPPGEAPFYGGDAATIDLGYMLHDLAFIEDPAGPILSGRSGARNGDRGYTRRRAEPRFFRARMVRGVIDVPHPDSPEVRS